MTKQLLTLFFTLCLVSLASAGDYTRIIAAKRANAGGGGGPVTHLVEDGYEEQDTGGALGSGTDGYDSTLVSAENEGTGTIDPDDTTATILSGSRQLKVVGVSSEHNYVEYDLGQEYTELWVRVKWKHSGFGSNRDWISFLNGSSVEIETVGWGGDFVMEFRNATGDWQPADPSVVGNYASNYQWYHYVSGGTCEVAVTSGTTMPSSGDNYASGTLTVSGGIRYLRFGPDGEDGTIFMDDLIISENEPN